MSDYLLIRTTVPSRELGRRISDELLVQRLAASVHIGGPTESRYWWQGEIRHAEEWFCEIRTLARSRKQVESVIRRLHTYVLPEIFVMDIRIEDPELRAWLEESADTYEAPGPR